MALGRLLGEGPVHGQLSVNVGLSLEVGCGNERCGRSREMVGPYRDEDARGRCVEGVGITGGGYTNCWDRGQDPRILQSMPSLEQLFQAWNGLIVPLEPLNQPKRKYS